MRVDVETLLRILDNDREILDQLIGLGVIPREADGYPSEQAETCRVARTLVRELDVNWPGVEIILRMREEMLATHRQVAELLAILRQAHKP